jgi:hypothetical protein
MALGDNRMGKLVKAKKVDDFLKFGLYAMSETSLFMGLTEEYRQKPSKKKAIALYKDFLGPNARAEINVDGNGAKLIKALGDTIKEMEKLKAEADDMNFFARWTSSGARKAAPEVFDDLVNQIAMGTLDCLREYDTAKKWDQCKHNNTLITDIAKQAHVKTWLTKSWEPVRKDLESVGFGSVKNLK